MRPAGEPRMLLVTTFGLGHLRPAPGTWGSMPPVAVAGVLVVLGLGPLEAPVVYHGVLALIFVVFCLATVVYGDWAEAIWNRKDPSQVVADETAGVCIPLVALPVAQPRTAVELVALAAVLAFVFLAFRLCDILKLPPSRQLESVRGGWGVLLDDLAMGVLALLIVQLVLRGFALVA